MALLAAIVIIGCIDQTSARSVPTYAATQTEYRSDAALVGQIEDRLPAGAAVFQLPYEPFPEPQPQWIPVAGPYDLARGYIHSHDLRWSYGLMKGRAGDWEAAAVQLPPPMLARAVVAAGFSGIYIDRSGYADNGEHVVAALLRETRAEAIASPNGRLAFLDLRTYAQRLRAKHSAVQVAALRRSVLHPLGVRVAGGPSDLKQDLQGRYYNAGQREQILIDNYDTQTRHVRIRLGLEPAFPAPATVRVVVAGQAADQVDVPAKGKTFGRELDLPPGVTPIELRTVGQPQADLPADPQTFYLRIRDPLVVDEAFDAFGGIPNSRRASAWLSPFGPI
jgi:phosphoglycerol transferase